MRVSVNKLRYINEHYDAGVNVVPDGVEALVERIGAQLGAVEAVIPFGDKFSGALIVRVVECEKHPNADKLSLCKIDDGGTAEGVERDGQGRVQVVCGAPNVRADMLAVWLPPGVTVPSTFGTSDPFVLEAREIRGQKSNGMLASPKELGIGDSHEGILEVDREVKPGTTFAKAYRTEGEVVLDIENKMFTHRPDCFGTMGIAREVAGIQQQAFKSPEWYTAQPELPSVEGAKLPLTITNELPNLVPRFIAVSMSSITVKPSPVWLQIVLTEAGIRPINNIVDYTNFYMLETGQPLHAYDYDKVKTLSGDKATLVIRNPKPGEQLALLNGKTITPRPEAIMIAADKQLIGLGGVMGGSETEVDDSTKNIILECANFDMYSVRRTSMEHGLFTDAVTRFTKGQSPLQNLAVLAKITSDLCEHFGGQVASSVVDDNHLDKTLLARNSIHPPVTVAAEFINTRLGLQLSAADMASLLKNVEFTVEVKGEELIVTAPFWRTDIELREDIVEEIGRLYGYDHLPLELPQRDLTPAPKDALLSLKAEIRERLVKAGANEILTYSFVHGDLLRKAGQDPAHAFQIANALSPDLQYYRLSLMPSLLATVHPNLKAGYDEFVLFELGKAHIVGQNDDAGLPSEDNLTGLIVAAANKLKKPGAPYYLAKKYLQALVRDGLTYQPVPENMRAYDITKPYDLNRTAFIYVGEVFLGIIGEFRPAAARALKLPKHCAGFELDTTALLTVLDKAAYTPLPRFPKVTQDISLKVPVDLAYQPLFDLVQAELDKVRPQNTLVELEPIDIYQRDDDKEHKQISLRLHIASYERTLTDSEVNKLLNLAAAAAKATVGAERL
ncbi:MAG TPA: phenylalanine--tRNA ligase subunit beta [Verrucomicrobiae bacterium]|nr:phenylalanine--tRNA ligase subunit beta [Verrucomicrobiae bacterium]